MAKTKVAIIGSGNIGTDLMFKVHRLSEKLEVGILVGIDPSSDGLARAKRIGIETTSDGVDGLIAHPIFSEIEVVFDASSANAHIQNAKLLKPFGKQLVDLTPAAIGPYIVPVVNLDENIKELNVNMISCGGQATIPVVKAISSVVDVLYAEIVASISSKSAGPGTRANIDEFTETTSRGLEVVGGAVKGKAIIILNPAEPPMIMRDTVQVLTPRLVEATEQKIRDSVAEMVLKVAEYVPGYKLKQEIIFNEEGSEVAGLISPENHLQGGYTKISVFLEVEGAAMYLPSYAGNLDIMTSAAMRTAESLVTARKDFVVV